MPSRTERYMWGRFLVSTDPIVADAIDFYSPVHTPINWQKPPKRGSLVVIGRRIFRVEDISHAEGPINPKAYLIDVNTGETEIVKYYDMKNPNILFIRK